MCLNWIEKKICINSEGHCERFKVSFGTDFDSTALSLSTKLDDTLSQFDSCCCNREKSEEKKNCNC